jgi:hypothetical protein
LLRNPAQVYIAPLQFQVTKRGSKASLHHPRYKLFFIPFLWLGVARVGPKPQFRKKTSECDWIACDYIFLSFKKNYKLNKNSNAFRNKN